MIRWDLHKIENKLGRNQNLDESRKPQNSVGLEVVKVFTIM